MSNKLEKEFNTTKTVITFVALLAIIIDETIMYPMTTSIVMMASVGLIVFGVLTPLLGTKHGEYRANRT
ncbi:MULTISPECIES: DUF7333 family protein [Halorubrum]